MSSLPDIETRWGPTTFLQAVQGGAPVEAYGYQWRGLVLWHKGWATPRTETRWTLTHIGSGGVVLHLIGSVSMVMPVASEVAKCSDWTLFDLPEGWRQTDPELSAKVWAICEANPQVQPSLPLPRDAITNADAQAVIAMREARP